VNGDPLLTGESSVYPNQNFSSVPTIWIEDQEQAARDGIGCLNGPMLYLIHRASARQIFQNGNFNPCATGFPVGLIVQCLQTDQDTPPPQGPALGPAGIAILSVGQHGGWFLGGNSVLNLPGWGVRGQASTDTNQFAGVYGFASGREPGVRGESGTSAGVVGRSFGTNPTGANSNPGVIGVGPLATAPRDDPSSWGGVLGMPAPPNPSTGYPGNPTGNGVVGRSPAGYAGLFFGDVRVTRDLFVTGNLFVSGPFKSAVVPHPDGTHRALQAVESPESWFEDFGRAELIEGRARVDLDPDFAAVADTEADYHVFLTPEGDSNGLYVAGREPLSFEVREQEQGRSTLTFSYRVVARRKDVAGERLPRVAAPPSVPEEPMLDEAALPLQTPPPEEPPSGWPEGFVWPLRGPEPADGGPE
jgi:hypothetical protein